MVVLEHPGSARETRIPWRTIILSIKWSATALALGFLFFATIGFFGGFTTYSGIGEWAMRIAIALPNSIAEALSFSGSDGSGRAIAVFLLITLTLCAAAVSTARDIRVYLMAALLILTATAIIALQQAQAFTPRIAALSQILVVAVCTLLALALLADFYRRPVIKFDSDLLGSLRIKTAFIYWVLVFVLCFFQFIAEAANPLRAHGETEGMILFVLLGAAFLFVSAYLFASFLAFCQLILWRGAFGGEYLSDTNVARFIADPIPGLIDGAATGINGIILGVFVFLTWFCVSICCLTGAVDNWRFLRLHAAAIGGALLIALFTADLSSLGTGLLNLFDFSGPPAP